MFSNKSHTAWSIGERKKFLESLRSLKNTLFYVVFIVFKLFTYVFRCMFSK